MPHDELRLGKLPLEADPRQIYRPISGNPPPTKEGIVAWVCAPRRTRNQEDGKTGEDSIHHLANDERERWEPAAGDA